MSEENNKYYDDQGHEVIRGRLVDERGILIDEESDTFTPDDETIYDYLVNKSHEFQYEQIIIAEIIKRLFENKEMKKE